MEVIIREMNLQDFEEIKDSISTDDNSYERHIEFAVFEEGKYTIPELEFKVGDEILKTPPYEIEVVNIFKNRIKNNLTKITIWTQSR